MKLTDLPLKGKQVLLRVDFNVPLDEHQKIIDSTRIDAALPTIKHILEQGASLVIMSHLGRPKGKYDPKYSLAPCATYLKDHLSYPIKIAPDCIGKETEKMAEALQPGEILLLENLRFHSAEEKPESDRSFAKALAQLGDLYVNDAFGTAHRKHSSTYYLPQYFPDKCAMGFLLEKEIEYLGKTVQKPERPFFALIGGAKISSKLGILNALLEKVDALFIGGAMSYTFMAAQKKNIGRSLFEADLLEETKKIYEKAKQRNVPLFLPLDFRVVTPEGKIHTRKIEEGFAPDEEGVDIGAETLAFYEKTLKEAKTLFWNGPFGKYEEEAFAVGTIILLKKVAQLKATTILGGGDLVAAAAKAGVTEQISHISTGGGATLEFIEKGNLPALDALCIED